MSADVLERNVRALLRRSYVPALPAPHFRDRLESLFLAEVARRGGARAATRHPVRRMRPAPLPRFGIPALAALAAALLAVLLGWRPFAGDVPATRDDLLARGAVALGLPNDTWRAADEEERVHGLAFVPPSLVVATPAEAELEILLTAGVVHVGTSSELALATDSGELVATLRSGSAWFRAGERREELAPGVAHVLRAAPVVDEPTLAAVERPPAREELAPVAPVVPPITAAPARVLTGRVVDATSGAAVNTFKVGLLRERTGNETHPPEVREFTGADGRFAWPDPPAGKQRVFVHANGYALCTLGEHDLTAPAELRAELVAGVSVRGSVVDGDGNPIAGALVLSENDAPTDGLLFQYSELAFWLPIATHTANDGSFELAHLTSGVHTLRANVDGYATGWLEDVRVPAAAGETLTFTLGAGGTVEGTVVRPDGTPWQGAEIVVVAMDQTRIRRTNFAHVVADAEGRYRFEHVPPTTMVVVHVHENDRPEVRPVQVEDGRSVRVDFGQPVRGIRLHGRVLRPDGRPVANHNLGLFDRRSSWYQDWVASTTQADGSFAFEGVKPGAYAFFLIDEMGRGVRCVGDVELASGAGDVEHDVHIPGGAITVEAREALSGDLVPETALILERLVSGDDDSDFSAFVLTDGAGRARFVDVRPGTYRVVAYPTRAGFSYGVGEAIVLGEDERVECEVLLDVGGAVDVRVTDPDGRALEGALVLFRDEVGGEHSFSRVPMTDPQGRYHANGLRPGAYQVLVRLSGYRGTPVPFRFELGSELEIPVLLVPIPPR